MAEAVIHAEGHSYCAIICAKSQVDKIPGLGSKPRCLVFT